MRKSVLCVDFDGVVHSYTSGWKGARNIPDPPVPGAIEFLSHMLDEGWDVAIHSSRSGQLGGRRAMRAWLRRYAGVLWYDGIMGHLGLESVRFPLFKPSARVTLDDRALTFTGKWPTSEELKKFTPWYVFESNKGG